MTRKLPATRLRNAARSRALQFARRTAPVLVTAGISLVALVALKDVWQRYAEAPWTRDARLRATVLQVAPDVSGPLTEVRVHDNQRVARGDVLFQVDTTRFALALEQARAALAQSRAGAAQARAALDNQHAQLAQARREADRSHRLSGLVAQETLEQGDVKVQQAEAAVALAEAAHAAADASRAAAEAAVRVAQLNLERTTVRSPVDGYLNDNAPHVGDYVSAGRYVLSMVDAAGVYADGYFEETKLQKIHPGQAVTLQLMGEGRLLRGRVESIAAGIEDRDRSSGANLLPNVNPSFNWVRLAQRVPVRIAIDDWPASQRPVIGRTATVSVVDDAPTQGHAARQGQS
ncbi:HlyD family efflux transporter periplasmic adaptor subunit [Pelomonas aquatica]|jgi:multidrug resistance efflux pump|uniref:HlyD family secretion protein n=1 Tax=Pelomonas aquatica TaxID=431058 RepID=A0A9X4LC70_9BURK|nr:HlyD family secretion protein [Pelomonas aquatica]MCY4753794.1 HlyD family secretion protein [Pelomonas aquatica]MDG0861121.1 HlyD family secretion protein [Pelomonas aquatica]